ncbi:hypothetical protein Q8F55_006142 [Vanrija albida]|uniref:Major facilitator superfamily (MFS) profile domain-containing protein n=1 Tax=Vanrija albida TaxID=181172 RepID=A0ABR3PWE5_9TREE
MPPLLFYAFPPLLALYPLSYAVHLARVLLPLKPKPTPLLKAGKQVRAGVGPAATLEGPEHITHAEDVLVWDAHRVAIVSSDPGRPVWDPLLAPGDESTTEARLVAYDLETRRTGVIAMRNWPEGRHLHLLGIGLCESADGTTILAAANFGNGLDGAVEVFRLDYDKAAASPVEAVTATYLHTLAHPDLCFPNAVVPLSAESVLVTNSLGCAPSKSALLAKAEMTLALPLSYALLVTLDPAAKQPGGDDPSGPRTTAKSKVWAKCLSLANGLDLSLDGRVALVASCTGCELHVYDVDPPLPPGSTTPADIARAKFTYRDAIPVGFAIDNLRVVPHAPDGDADNYYFLGAGHPSLLDYSACAEAKGAGKLSQSRVVSIKVPKRAPPTGLFKSAYLELHRLFARVDPRTTTIFEDDGSEFGTSSTGVSFRARDGATDVLVKSDVPQQYHQNAQPQQYHHRAQPQQYHYASDDQPEEYHDAQPHQYHYNLSTSSGLAEYEKGGHSNIEVVDDDSEHITEAESRRVARKVDLHVLPLFCAVFALQFLDKTALTYTTVMTFFIDTGITQDQYGWMASIFSIGYLVGQYPTCIALQRLPVSKFAAFSIVMWGLMVCLHVVCNRSFVGYMIVRFFLGVFESTLSPALMLFTQQYYKANEQGTRTGIWASFATWAGIVGAGVAYALAKAEGSDVTKSPLTMPAWKAFFLFLGCSTIFVGLCFAIFIPDKPEQARFFNARDKVVSRIRTRDNKQELFAKQWQWYQVWDALTDPQVWAASIIAFLAAIPTSGITTFYGIFMVGMGFPPLTSILLSMVNCWVSFFTIAILYMGDRFRKRALFAIIPTAVSITGACMVWQISPRLSDKIARLAGFYLTLSFAVAAIAAMSLITTNVAGRTKTTTAQAMFLICTCLGGFVGPKTWKQGPKFTPAWVLIIACNATNICLLFSLDQYYRWQNRKRDREGRAAPEGKGDLTDRENPTYRYVY